MPTRQKVIGNKAENDAYVYLKKKGMRLIAKNYHCRYGEIDLIMRDCEQIVFVEVRCRTTSAYSTAIESITPSKINRIVKTATFFLQEKKLLNKVPSRFDVVGIQLSRQSSQIDWIKNVFNA